MPMPYLKPLIDAAHLVYQQIREPKEASYFHQLATSAASFVGYEDTSGAKKSALGQLADMKLSGTVEEQNQAFGLMLETLLKHSNDGTNFKALVEILLQCSALAENPRTASPVAIQFELQNALFTLQNELKNSKHVFFLELSKFFQAMEMYVKELLEEDHQVTKHQLARTLQRLDNAQQLNMVQTQALGERDTTLATTSLSKHRLHSKLSNQLQSQKTAFALMEKTLEARLEQKTLELNDLNKALEESQKKLAETKQAFDDASEQQKQALQALQKSKTAIIMNAVQLKRSLKKESEELYTARLEIHELKKKITELETDIKNGNADYIRTHLDPVNNQLKAVTEELRQTKAQQAQTQSKPLQNTMAATYKQHGLYASKDRSKEASSQAPRQFQAARNTPH